MEKDGEGWRDPCLHIGEEDRRLEQRGGAETGGDRKARGARDREARRRHRLVPRPGE